MLNNALCHPDFLSQQSFLFPPSYPQMVTISPMKQARGLWRHIILDIWPVRPAGINWTPPIHLLFTCPLFLRKRSMQCTIQLLHSKPSLGLSLCDSQSLRLRACGTFFYAALIPLLSVLTIHTQYCRSTYALSDRSRMQLAPGIHTRSHTHTPTHTLLASTPSPKVDFLQKKSHWFHHILFSSRKVTYARHD